SPPRRCMPQGCPSAPVSTSEHRSRARTGPISGWRIRASTNPRSPPASTGCGSGSRPEGPPRRGWGDGLVTEESDLTWTGKGKKVIGITFLENVIHDTEYKRFGTKPQ